MAGETFSWKRGRVTSKNRRLFFQKKRCLDSNITSYTQPALDAQDWYLTKWCIQILPFVVPQCFLVKEIPDVCCFFVASFFSQVNDGTKPGTGFHSECLSHIFVGLSAGISASTEWKTRVQTQSRACVEYTPWISVVAKSALWMERNTHRLQCFWKRKLEIFLVFELPKQFLRCEGVSCPIAKRVTIFKVIRKELATNVFGCVLGIHRSFKAAKKLSAI